MLKCNKVKEELVSLVKSELNESEANEIQEHLTRCPVCRKEKDEIDQLSGLLQDRERIEPAAEVWTGLQARIKEAAKIPAGHYRAPTRRRWSFRWPAWTKGVAAAIIIGLFIGGLILVRGNKVIRYPHQKYVAEITRITGEGMMPDAESLPITGFVDINKPMRIPAALEVVMDLVSQRKGPLVTSGSVTIKGPARLEFKSRKRMKLSQGEVRIKLAGSEKGWVVQTSYASVKTIGTRFIVKATPDNTVVVVTKGKVKFYNRMGSVIVVSGFQSYARDRQKPVQPIALSTLPLVACTRVDTSKITSPIIKIVPTKTVFNPGEVIRLKWQITNQDDELWFTPFLAGSAYLFLNVTNPQGKMFYARFNPAEVKEILPAGFKEEFGLVSFPKQATYELTGRLNEILEQPGQYQLVGVYGAAPGKSGDLKVWGGLIESEPVEIEVR